METAKQGNDYIIVENTDDWKVGKKIALTTTGNAWNQHEELTVKSLSAEGQYKKVTLD